MLARRPESVPAHPVILTDLIASHGEMSAKLDMLRAHWLSLPGAAIRRGIASMPVATRAISSARGACCGHSAAHADPFRHAQCSARERLAQMCLPPRMSPRRRASREQPTPRVGPKRDPCGECA